MVFHIKEIMGFHAFICSLSFYVISPIKMFFFYCLHPSHKNVFPMSLTLATIIHHKPLVLPDGGGLPVFQLSFCKRRNVLNFFSSQIHIVSLTVYSQFGYFCLQRSAACHNLLIKLQFKTNTCSDSLVSGHFYRWAGEHVKRMVHQGFFIDLIYETVLAQRTRWFSNIKNRSN